MNRTPERIQFLSDLLITAIEHCGYGFPGIVEYKPELESPHETYAVIFDRYELEEEEAEEPSQTWRVDIDVMAKGLGILREKYGQSGSVHMRDLFEANRENDAGITDVVGALAVLEAAVFGDVTYN